MPCFEILTKKILTNGILQEYFTSSLIGIFNLAYKGHARLVYWNHFCLRVGMCACVLVCVHACLSVCLSPRALITSGMMWCDTGREWLVKPILQLFSLLSSINWMGMTSMPCTQGKDVKVDNALAMEGGI